MGVLMTWEGGRGRGREWEGGGGGGSSGETALNLMIFSSEDIRRPGETGGR